MKGRAVFRNTEIAIAFAIERSYADASIEKIADARDVSHAREFGKQRSALLQHFRLQLRLSRDKRANGFLVIARAGGNQGLDSSERDRAPMPLKEVERGGAPTTGGEGDRGSALAISHRGVGAVVEQERNCLDTVIAADRLVQRPMPPTG